jgi:hypothetical protein
MLQYHQSQEQKAVDYYELLCNIYLKIHLYFIKIYNCYLKIRARYRIGGGGGG